MGLYSERDNWFQTGALADAAEIRYTKKKFILNTFLSCCNGVFFAHEVRNSYSGKIISSENEKSVINSD